MCPNSPLWCSDPNAVTCACLDVCTAGLVVRGRTGGNESSRVWRSPRRGTTRTLNAHRHHRGLHCDEQRRENSRVNEGRLKTIKTATQVTPTMSIECACKCLSRALCKPRHMCVCVYARSALGSGAALSTRRGAALSTGDFVHRMLQHSRPRLQRQGTRVILLAALPCQEVRMLHVPQVVVG